MNQPQHYADFDHTNTTVEQMRAIFGDWCAYLSWLRSPDNPDNHDGPAITLDEYHDARRDLERWYSWIAHERDAAYMERMRLVQLELFEATR